MWPTPKSEPVTRPVVMIVDDEEHVRTVEAIMLEQAGYEVLCAGGADEALQVMHDASAIDMVVADVHMPEVTGDEMARRIRALRPDMKILFVTGYSDTLFSSQPLLWDGQAYLDKPFTRRALLEAVSMLLHGDLQHCTA